jgi:hypothetical protein
MREPISLVRRTVIAATIVALSAMPLAAQQTNSNTTSTTGVVGQQDTRRSNDRGFPWGLLGLLGLGGLMGRRRDETVRTVPPASTTRTGDVGSRM